MEKDQEDATPYWGKTLIPTNDYPKDLKSNDGIGSLGKQSKYCRSWFPLPDDKNGIPTPHLDCLPFANLFRHVPEDSHQRYKAFTP